MIHVFDSSELEKFAMELAGAATRPCLEAAPTLVMPSDEVAKSIQEFLGIQLGARWKDQYHD